MKRLAILLLVILLCGPVTPIHAKDVKVFGIDILECGTYTREISKAVDDKSAAGYRFIVKNERLVKQTDRIPATVGHRFGVFYRANGEPRGSKIKLRVDVTYPSAGLRNPKTGKTSYRDTFYETAVIGKRTLTGYGFDEAWEAVPGKWIFTLWYDKRKLAEKIFTVYRP